MILKPLGLIGEMAISIEQFAVDHPEIKSGEEFYNQWISEVAYTHKFPMDDSEYLKYALELIPSCIAADKKLLAIDLELESASF